MRRLLGTALLLALVGVSVAACEVGEDTGDLTWEEVWDGKDDSWNNGIPNPSSVVWQVRHAWTDRAPNGETYEEYYATWLASIQHDAGGRDVRYVLGDGTVVPAPSLECADSALFLRFLYAEEHGLPMFVGVYGSSGLEFMGHFGWVTRNGTPIRSYSASLSAPRGSDSQLAATARYLPDYDQDYPAAGATTGGYLDAVLTNKRFGYFLQDLWNMVYSGDVAANVNTYYIRPEAIRGGDLQLHRYSATDGIGHTITIQRIERTPSGALRQVDVIQSYMPTKPWTGNGYSELTTYRPDPTSHGGLRRWRRPELRSGRWYLMTDQTVAAADADVPSNPERFAELFSMSVEDEVNSLVATIDQRRQALVDNPNSCNRRREREEAFDQLYELYATTPELYQQIGFTSEPTVEEVVPAVDQRHRIVEDFIWAPMDYEGSRVCHWNPANVGQNRAMYNFTVQFNRARLEQQGCQGLRVFRAENAQYCEARDGNPLGDVETCADVPDGFQDLREAAVAAGFSWADYVNDEGGDLRNVTTDQLADPTTLDRFCALYGQIGFAE